MGLNEFDKIANMRKLQMEGFEHLRVDIRLGKAP